LMDVLGSEADVVPERVLAEDELAELLEHLSSLGEKERKVIELRFGIRSPRRTQREIAKLLGISRSYVSRIDKCAADRMQRHSSWTPERARASGYGKASPGRRGGRAAVAVTRRRGRVRTEYRPPPVTGEVLLVGQPPVRCGGDLWSPEDADCHEGWVVTGSAALKERNGSCQASENT
jgi:predicted XRE-type DNA-binding protein